MNPLLRLPILLFGAAISTTAAADPIITDTFGDTSGGNSAQHAYKLDLVGVTQLTTLHYVSPYLDSSGGDEIEFVVYQRSGPETYDLVWSSGPASLNPPGEEFKESPFIGIRLEPGEVYAFGFYLGDDEVGYSYDDNAPSQPLGWGVRDGALYTSDGDTPALPDPIEDDVSEDLAYHMQLTVEPHTDLDGDLSPDFEDCDDDDPSRYPGADELCDGIDQDCDGYPDNDVVYTDYWPDGDGDGFGDVTMAPTSSCNGPPSGMVANDDDCDDIDPDVNPDAAEICNGLDENCDGYSDEGIPERDWYPDNDGDEYGDAAAAPLTTCDEAPKGTVNNALDCDDANPDINPLAEEICDGIDNDCDDDPDDGLPANEWYPDDDGDGYGDMGASADVTCDETRAGYVTNDDDCDDSDDLISPDAEEVCNGLDDNCDGVPAAGEDDTDGDGALDCEDCSINDPEVYPGAVDECNGVDNDCDGVIPTKADCDPNFDERVTTSPYDCASAGTTPSGALALLAVLAVAARRRS